MSVSAVRGFANFHSFQLAFLCFPLPSSVPGDLQSRAQKHRMFQVQVLFSGQQGLLAKLLTASGTRVNRGHLAEGRCCLRFQDTLGNLSGFSGVIHRLSTSVLNLFSVLRHNINPHLSKSKNSPSLLYSAGRRFASALLAARRSQTPASNTNGADTLKCCGHRLYSLIRFTEMRGRLAFEH